MTGLKTNFKLLGIGFDRDQKRWWILTIDKLDKMQKKCIHGQ